MANTPKVKYIRVKEDSSAASYRVIVIVKNDKNNRVNDVDVQFSTPTGNNPVPSSSEVTCNFLKQTSNNRKRYRNTTLTFTGGSALNLSYNLTATMKRANGNTIGKPYTVNVVVDSVNEDDEPVVPTLLDADIVETGLENGSYKAQLIVWVSNDTGNTVNTVDATTSPDEPNAPVANPSSVVCTYSSTDADGFKRYIATLNFPATSVGAQYTVTLTMKNAQGGTVGSTVKLSAVESEQA